MNEFWRHSEIDSDCPLNEEEAERRLAVSRRSLLRWGAGSGLAAGALGLMGSGATAAPATGGRSIARANQDGSGEYVEVLALTTLPYFIDHKAGLEEAGKQFGVKTRFVGPAEYDMNAMISTMEQVTLQKPAGLIVVGFDAVLKPAIDNAVAAGIPTVTVDADVYGSNRYFFLGTGNVAAGQQGGQVLIDAIGGSGQVVIVTKVGQSNLEERIAGYKQAIDATNGAVELVEVLNDDSDSQKAASAVAAALGKYPDLKGIACVEAAGGVGAATAVKEAGRVGDIKIVSMDRDDNTLNFVQDGTIHASIAQKTALMPYLSVLILKAYNDQRVSITQDDAQAKVLPLPNAVDTGSEVITQDNVSFWYHK